MKKFIKNLELWLKAYKRLKADRQKAWQRYKTAMAKITFLFVLFVTVCACNSVRATVKGGATTTITVTTNNPSTTQVNPNTQTDLKLK